MSAAGVPQSYLASQRPNISTMRDMSMDQNYTNSGNPQGYVPPNFARYTPPMESNPNGKWNTGGLQYSLPTSYGSYASSTPPLPKFNPQSIYNAFANAGRQNQFGGGGIGNNRNGAPMPQFNQQQWQHSNPGIAATMQNTGQQAGGVTAGLAPSNVSDMMKQFAAQHQPTAPVPATPGAPMPQFRNGGLSQGADNYAALVRQY